MSRRAQRGVALLTAMLILALVAIISTAMLSQMNLAMHRSGNVWNTEQAWWYAVGAENWIGRQLRRDAKYTKIDTLQEAWAKPVDYLPLEGGSMSGRLVDEQGRFNINNLLLGNPQQAMAQLQRLIEQACNTDQVTAQTIAAATRDWIDPDIDPTRPAGAEDDYYLGLTPAYRTANAPMVSPSELRLVKGVTPAIYRQLAPYISTLPAATPINVNTAPAAVLETLIEGLPAGTGQALVKARERQPWQDITAFEQADATAGKDFKSAPLAVKTRFFLLGGRIVIDQSELTFYSLLERADNGAVQVVRHSTNAY